MSEKELDSIAENADLIVKGYAFKRRDDGFISILNLNSPDCAMVVSDSSEMIETNMDRIEQVIVLDLCRRNICFLRDGHA